MRIKNILKRTYNLLPFKKQIFTFIKLFGTPDRKIYQHLHFIDNIAVKVNNEGGFKIRHYGYQIENEIFWNGVFNGWEKVSLSIWAELCKNATVILDIGANTGLYSLLAKTVNYQASVYAFEPVDRVYEKLLYNNQLNSFDIRAYKKAISNYDGHATIFDKDVEHILSVTVNNDRSEDHSNSIPVQIETLRVDTLIEEDNIPIIDVMKIDVETHEVEVLEGLGEYLYKFKPSLIIEILNDEVAYGIEKKILNIGYDYYVIDENSGVQKVDSLRKSDYYNFLICMPEVSKNLKSIAHFSRLYQSQGSENP